MKERPILFSGPMVCAILEGRKTQTRRIVKNVPTNKESYLLGCHKSIWGIHENVENDAGVHRFTCPYGVTGDRLWVRETTRCHNNVMIYSAGYPELCVPVISNDSFPFGVTWKCKRNSIPSIHMPRWASRLTLEITGVRVERLNDISEQDAIAEGCESTAVLTADGRDYMGLYAKEHYAALWESINGPGSWNANPWVWVVEFKQIEVAK